MREPPRQRVSLRAVIRYLVPIVLAVGVDRAVADQATADRLVAEAEAAAAADDYKTAAAKFAEAYLHDPTRTDVYCNIGISYFKVGGAELPRAHLLMQQCVTKSARDLAFKDKAKAVVEQIEQTLRAGGHTPVTIRAMDPAGATIVVREFGPESKFIGTNTVWLPFGTHHVDASSDGYKDTSITIETSTQEPKSVEIRLDKQRPATPPVTPPPPPSAPTKLVPLATSVAAVGGVVLSIIAFRKAREAADRGPFALDPEALDGEQSEVTKWNVLTIAGGVVGVGAGVASYFLWRRALATRTEIDIKPGGGGASVMVRGRF